MAKAAPAHRAPPPVGRRGLFLRWGAVAVAVPLLFGGATWKRDVDKAVERSVTVEKKLNRMDKNLLLVLRHLGIEPVTESDD